MNKRYNLLLLLLFPLFSIAQSNYKSGYVVTLKGDTLHGYINLKEWGHNPKDISFKASLNDKAKQLGLPDIKYFDITGYLSYRAFTVTKSLNPIDIAAPSTIADTATETDNVFLRVVQPGKNVTLYAYRDNIKERFYMQEAQQGRPVELFYGIYEGPNGSDKVISKNTYQSQLTQLVLKYNPGNDKLIVRIQQSPYQEESFVAIVAGINGDASNVAAKRSADKSSALRFFAGAGFISNTLTAGQYYGHPSSKSSVPKIAAGVDLIINPAVGHLVFRLELAYSVNNYTFKAVLDPLDNVANPAINSVRVKQNIISITPQAIYNIYNGQRLKVFVDLGYSLGMLSYPPNQISQTGGNFIISSNYKFDSKSEYSAFQFKAGLVIAKRLEIYGAYFPSANLTDAIVYRTDMSSYQIGLNYYFGKGAR